MMDFVELILVMMIGDDGFCATGFGDVMMIGDDDDGVRKKIITLDDLESESLIL
jgi:hypothetical protein